MDQALTILFGAGAFFMIAAFFIKNRSDSSRSAHTAVVQKNWERAEMEKSLQHFVQQVKQESEAVALGMVRTKADLQNEVAQLRDRLEQTEKELAGLTAQVQSMQTLVNRAPRLEIQEEADDLLSLRERYRRAFEWRQQGLDLDEIAKRLGAGRGELELIFSLASPQERGENHG
jgi:membrane-bound lytic murein transglycosylase